MSNNQIRRVYTDANAFAESINSNCSVVGCETYSAQEQWPRRNLTSHNVECTLAMWHHPRFSSLGCMGQTGKQMPFIITGHDHDYERFAPQNPEGKPDESGGIRQFVVGTGGASLYTITQDALATTEVRN